MIFARRHTLSLLFILLGVIGLLSWSRLPVELTPDITLPSVTIGHQWGSTAPEVMETMVTRRVETAAYRLRDVAQVRSTTSEGSSRVVVEFRKKAPVDFRIVELQEALHTLHEDLPKGVSTHTLTRAVPRELADVPQFMTWSLNGTLEPADLRRIAEERIRIPLLGTGGLAGFEIHGVPEPALILRFDAPSLDRLGLRVPMILSEVSTRLSWRSAGFAEGPGGRYDLVLPPTVVEVGDIEAMPVALPGTDRTIRLGELARVERGTVPPRQVTRINGNQALTLILVKEPGADALVLAERIRRQMDRIASDLPAGLELRLENDATDTIRTQLGELRIQAGWSIGVILVLLLVFLRQIKAPLVILGSIAGSLFLSAIVLLLLGYTLNLLTLAGLAVSLGMIIDNAVVVYERVHPGLPAERSARVDHVRRVLPTTVIPVIGATLTTVGIFIPVLFAMEGLRALLEPLAVALTTSLVSSVIVSLVFIPYALIWIFGAARSVPEEQPATAAWLGRFIRVRHRIRYALGFLFICISAYAGWRATQEVRFGDPWRLNTGETIHVGFRAPQGSPLDEIDKIARSFESLIEPYRPWIAVAQTDLSEYGSSGIRITLNEGAATEPEPYRLLGELIYLAARTGNLSTSVYGLQESFSVGLGGGASTHNLVLTGYGYEELAEVAEDLKRRLERNRRIANVNTNAQLWMRSDFHRFILHPDAERLADLGIDRNRWLDALSLDLNADQAFGDVEWNGERLRLMGRSEASAPYWADIRDRTRRQDGAAFTVGDVAVLGRERGLGQIIRRNQAYERTVSYEFMGPYQSALDFQKEVKAEVPLPVGVRFLEGSRFRVDDGDSRTDAVRVLGMAVLSVWMIVAALLNRFRTATFVLTAVLYAVIGILTGVLFLNLSIGQGAIAGALLTIGVVVNNAILLYHGRSHLDSWQAAYHAHARTVLLTSLTTIGGLIPMLVWGQDVFWTQLATVVVWGLGTSTALVLLITGMWERP
jgi:multidrug efflux pump subunit AcrB